MNTYLSKKTKAEFTWVRRCWVIAQFLLIGGGVLALHNPGEKLVETAVYLGILMFLVGSINVVVYMRKKAQLHGSQWLLADGMCTMLLSLFPLFNQIILPAILPFFFGVWELFLGVLKVIDASELKEENISGWRWFQAIGCLEILSGVASLLKPVDDFMGMNVVVAIIFFIQSFGFLFKVLVYPKLVKEQSNIGGGRSNDL